MVPHAPSSGAPPPARRPSRRIARRAGRVEPQPTGRARLVLLRTAAEEISSPEK